MSAEKPKIETKEVAPSDDGTPDMGIYDEMYETLQSIGKGAFGFVKLAKRRSDDEHVRIRQHFN